MAAPVSHLTSHLGYWLRYVSNHVSHAFARKLEGEGVTVAEWVLLRELYGEQAVAPSRLAERIGQTRGAISKLSDRLLAKGLIVREDSPEDRRAHSLALSAPGRELVPRLSALADRNDAEFFEHLTAQERDTVERVMRGIVERRGLSHVPVD
ncbi:MarR family transcriptional regulator [Caulobacter vibrioides]|nr:MarR family transcriptional regulator [Caulobacter vibrioides]